MRAPSNKVFKDTAKHGKTIMGYFFGFKFHIIINHFGQLVDVFISAGNVADNNKVLLRKITENFLGLLIGNKGYITSLKDEFLVKGINLVTKTRKNREQIKYTPRVEYDKKRRGLIEKSNNLLKNKANIQHTSHRNTVNFEVNFWAALIAYSYNDKLPAIKTFMEVQKPLDPLAATVALKIAV